MNNLADFYSDHINDPIEWGTFHYRSVALRADFILKGRPVEEVKKILEKIEWLFMCWQFPEEMEEREPALEGQRIRYLYEDEEGLSDPLVYPLPTQLFLSRNDVLTQEILGQKNIEWPIWFAALARALLISAIRKQRSAFETMKKGDHKMGGAFLIYGAGELADAMEAIVYAERLMNIDDDLRDKISQQNKRAAASKHAKTNSLKESFVAYYRSKTFQSKADAARRFYDDLPSDKKRLLRPTNAIRTLTAAIAD